MKDPDEALGTYQAHVLVVDLDGTLIKTDMLYETFWSAVSKNWRNVFTVASALSEGRAHLKRTLEERGPVDVAALPFNEKVIQYVREWRADGGRTALVSASDQRIVDRVAAEVGLFDEAFGSDGEVNLKGERKAEFLIERYGFGGFSYMGDAEADLPVWRNASTVITVDLPARLVAQVEATSPFSKHLITRSNRGRALFRAIRPHQWLKNVLVFLPMLAGHQFDIITFGQALLAFVAFSFIASAVYLLNDLLDLAADRAHPRKRMRPFASGALPLTWGTVLVPALMVAGFGIAALMGPALVAVMALYFVATTAYSFWLKRLLLIDICTLACLYTLRIVAGGVATNVPLSVWLLAFSLFFFFALATMKRQAELVSGQSDGKEAVAGRDYRTSDLPLTANMAVSSGYVSVLVMALYIDSGAVQELYNQTLPLWGICLVLLYWLSRMVMMTHRGSMDDDPVVFAAKDRVSLLCVALIFGLAISGMML